MVPLSFFSFYSYLILLLFISLQFLSNLSLTKSTFFQFIPI